MPFGRGDDLGGTWKIQRHGGRTQDVRLEFIQLLPEFIRRVTTDDIIEDANLRTGIFKGGGHIGHTERRGGRFFQWIGRCDNGDSHGPLFSHLTPYSRQIPTPTLPLPLEGEGI